MRRKRVVIMPQRNAPGIHAHRLNEHNPREVAFAAQWDQELEYHDILQTLCSQACGRNDEGAVRVFDPFGVLYRRYPVGAITERDRVIAATLIQWLGSNVGLAFVTESLRRCGYVIEKKKTAED